MRIAAPHQRPGRVIADATGLAQAAAPETVGEDHGMPGLGQLRRPIDLARGKPHRPLRPADPAAAMQRHHRGTGGRARRQRQQAAQRGAIGQRDAHRLGPRRGAQADARGTRPGAGGEQQDEQDRATHAATLAFLSPRGSATVRHQ